MRALLDINVLIALLDASHQHHEAARDRMIRSIRDGRASCPITQNGFIRILSQPSYVRPRSRGARPSRKETGGIRRHSSRPPGPGRALAGGREPASLARRSTVSRPPATSCGFRTGCWRRRTMRCSITTTFRRRSRWNGCAGLRTRRASRCRGPPGKPWCWADWSRRTPASWTASSTAPTSGGGAREVATFGRSARKLPGMRVLHATRQS